MTVMSYKQVFKSRLILAIPAQLILQTVSHFYKTHTISRIIFIVGNGSHYLILIEIHTIGTFVKPRKCPVVLRQKILSDPNGNLCTLVKYISIILKL